MKWINTKDELPEEGKYVLARHNRHTWIDNSDQDNVNCVIVKLVKGISEGERSKLSLENNPRSREYRSSDEHSNNLKPYNWEPFGPDNYFGQEINYWLLIEDIDNEEYYEDIQKHKDFDKQMHECNMFDENIHNAIFSKMKEHASILE